VTQILCDLAKPVSTIDNRNSKSWIVFFVVTLLLFAFF